MPTKTRNTAGKKSVAEKPKTDRPKASSRPLPEDAPTFLAALDHPLKADIETVRKLILAADPAIRDGVKWNSLSFRHTDWFATVNLRSQDMIQLVMHTGAKAKDNPKLKIPDENGLLVWLAKDRALEQTQLQLNLGDSRFKRLMIPFVSAGQEAGGHDTSPVDGSA